MTPSDEYQTPKIYIKATRKVMGSIDLAAASSDINNLRVKAKFYYSKQDSALNRNWHAVPNGNIWLNPPYSKPNLTLFTDDLIRNYIGEYFKQATYLVPSYTSERWYHKCLNYCSAFCLPNHRIQFLIDGRRQTSPRFANTFFYFGNFPIKFIEIFSQFGKCFLNR